MEGVLEETIGGLPSFTRHPGSPEPKQFTMLNFNVRLYVTVIPETGLEKYMVSHPVAGQV